MEVECVFCDVEVGEAERRRAFAEWLVDEQNPLTARVVANRVWQ